jgi:hypothetical protein
MAGNWTRTAVSAIFMLAVTAIYWPIAGLLSVAGLFMFFGDYDAGHGGDAAYMREMYREVTIGRWIALGVGTMGYAVIVAAILRARWFRGK